FAVNFASNDCLKLPQHVFGKRRLSILAHQFVDSDPGSREDVARWLRAARAAINDRRGKMLLLPKKGARFLELEKFSENPGCANLPVARVSPPSRASWPPTSMPRVSRYAEAIHSASMTSFSTLKQARDSSMPAPEIKLMRASAPSVAERALSAPACASTNFESVATR